MAFASFLLIDDDPDDLELFSAALREASPGASCMAVDSAGRAIEILLSGAVKFDVVFVDLNMPKIDGLEFLRKAQDIKILKNVPVFVYSTTFSPHTRDKAIMLGASDLITKHSSISELITFLSKLA